MSLFERCLQRIESNRLKQHNCIPINHRRFSEVFPGIQQNRYYLVSGASGAGKSQFTDEMFVINPYDYILNNETKLKLKVFYYSLEVDARTKMDQWIARRLYTEYNIRTGPNVLLSVGDYRVNDQILMAIKETRAYFEQMEDSVKIFDGSVNPQGIINAVEEYSKLNGKTVKRKQIIKGREEEVFDHYIPNDPNEYVVIIVDHLSLLNTETTAPTIKQAIEKLSSYFVKARNRYGYIPVAIQQQSAESENIEHFKLDKMIPSKTGLGESKLTYNDVDMALGIFQPQKHDIKTYRGYNVLEMGDAYRSVSVFKNRYGVSNVNIGMYFDGAVNYFKELPKAESMIPSTYEAVKKRIPNW